MGDIREIHNQQKDRKRPFFSFEFFPPKTEAGVEKLLTETAPELKQLQPDFCSITYGAGGSTRDATVGIAERLQKEADLETMMHLTCVNATKEELHGVVDDAVSRGIQNFLALRGDPPGGGDFMSTEGGFEYSYQLVEFLREKGDFTIAAAGFPEGHIACTEGKHVDWERLVNKVKTGVDFVVTQLFYDNKDFFEFRDFVSKRLDKDVPIAVGVLPILSTKQIRRFTSLCGAKLTPEIESTLDKLGDDTEAVTEFGIDYSTRQCQELLDNGVHEFHFYTLNRTYSTQRLLENLGLAPK